MFEILSNNNILLCLATIMPALFYSIMVWFKTPAHTVKLKVAFLYMLMGALSTVMVTQVHWVFPQWDNQIFLIHPLISCFFFSFFQVAILEEGCKFVLFKIADSYRYKHWIEHPAATMFYAMSIGTGFAIIENMMYLQMLTPDQQDYAPTLLLSRTFTSMVVHMICGVIMGYFIALGKIKESHGEFAVLSSNQKKINKYWYYTLAIGCAAAFHGFYDFSIFATQKSIYSYWIVVLGLGIAYLMGKKYSMKPFEKNDTGKS